MTSRWARTLNTELPNPLLDLADYVGQRRSTFTFELVDSLTGYRETINPLKSSIPNLTHNTASTIKRQISGLFLSVADTAKFNSVRSRLDVTMLLDDVNYPLGRYIPSSQLREISTAGTRSFPAFYDESFIVDQEITSSFTTIMGSGSVGGLLQTALEEFLARFPISFTIEPSSYTSIASWPMGTRGGYVIEQMAIDGDWFPPWFDNTNVMRFIRAFDPATAIPTFNFDTGNKVFRARILESDDLINAPNRFVVISNGASAVGEGSAPVFGVYEVPSSAPHSITNRGFIIQKTENRQLNTQSQAQAVANNLGQQHTIFETVELDTAPDPRHDSYDVIRWQGSNWLEIGWSLPLLEGSLMRHTLRKAYAGE